MYEEMYPPPPSVTFPSSTFAFFMNPFTLEHDILVCSPVFCSAVQCSALKCKAMHLVLCCVVK